MVLELKQYISRRERSYLAGFIQGREPFQRGPYFIEIEVTERCNARCYFCNQGQHNKAKKHMPFDLFEKIVRELKENGLRAIVLSGGGEPTTHPDILKMLDLVNSLELSVALVTNGILLKGELLKRLKKSKLTHVHISLNSPDSKTWSKINGCCEKYFFEVIDNIKELRRSFEPKNCLIIAKLILNELTHMQVNDMLTLCRSLGIDWSIRDLNSYSYSSYFQEKCVPELSKKIFDITNIENAKQMNFFYIPELITLRRILLKKMLKREYKGKKTEDLICANPWVSAQIRTNGDVSLCCHTFGMNPLLGNCYKEGFMPIWLGEEYNQLRAEHLKKDSENVKFYCSGRWDIVDCPFPFVLDCAETAR